MRMIDIYMPLMDGFEFVERYYDSLYSNYPNTKVFIYSTSIHSADIRKAESMKGISGFIPKPFNENTFDEYISPHLSPK